LQHLWVDFKRCCSLPWTLLGARAVLVF